MLEAKYSELLCEREFISRNIMKLVADKFVG